ncbi:transcriptional regulator [Mycolicibacterium litorale]|uniref:Transcriptional regulator n=1 Tax=Mycolicibacterium litorale TaxID=758802 RepID=A0A6S6NWD1_9MYCO|nr:helix-turn-helix transcriptional regulator [Mycolicibacterium litorale]BCI51433.1 transcriptional regulator [Mycolicibacterium litorale]
MPQDENLAAVVTNAAQDIGSFIRSQREAAQVSVRQLAEKAGVSNPYLSQIERGLRKPSADVLNQIAKALRVSAEVLYVRAGILEPSEAGQVRDAIVNDTAITERQKQVLLDIYTSFCQQNEAAVGEVDEEPTTDYPPLTGDLTELARGTTPQDPGKDIHHG